MHVCHLKELTGAKKTQNHVVNFLFHMWMGFFRTLLDVVSGLSLSNHLQEQKDRRMHATELPHNPGFHTCSPSQLTIWERKERRERKGRVDVTMIKTCSRAVELTRGSCTGLALPDQRHHASALGTSPFVRTWLHHPARTTPLPCQAPADPPWLSFTYDCPFPLHLSNSNSEIKESEPEADKILRRPCARSTVGVEECPTPARHLP